MAHFEGAAEKKNSIRRESIAAVMSFLVDQAQPWQAGISSSSHSGFTCDKKAKFSKFIDRKVVLSSRVTPE